MNDPQTSTTIANDPVAERDRIIDSQRKVIDELMSHTRRVISISHLVLAKGMSDDLVSDLKSVEEQLQTANLKPSLTPLPIPEPTCFASEETWKSDAVKLYNLGYSCGAISMYLDKPYNKVHYFICRLPGYSKFKGNRTRTRMNRKSWLTRQRLKAMHNALFGGAPSQ